MAMTVQEPQLLDKMENVAYRLTAQADERKKHMQSRYLYAEFLVVAPQDKLVRTTSLLHHKLTRPSSSCMRKSVVYICLLSPARFLWSHVSL